MQVHIANPIQQFRQEHAEALEVLDRLAVALQQLSSADAMNTAHEAIVFLEGELRAHNEREEECLFPILETVLPSPGPTAVMRAEHREIWNLVSALKLSMQQAPPTPLVARETGLMLVDLLRRHIDKENGILFPMAQQLLSSEAMSSVARGMEAMLEAEKAKPQLA